MNRWWPDLRAAPREVEFKLDLSAEAAARLAMALSVWAPPAYVHQQATYFDTPYHRLFAAGLTLRIRRDDGNLVQTVKTRGAAAGLFDRGEWAQAVAGPRPVVDSRVAPLALDQALVDRLVPIFAIETERSCWSAGPGSTVEIAIDHVLIRAGERQSVFAELELETSGGDVRPALALMRRFEHVAPLRLGVSSKAERGYRLLGPACRAFKAGAITLDRDGTAGQALAVLITAGLRHYRLNEAVLLDWHDAEAVHQARVAIRRLRATLAAFAPLIGARQREIDAALRRVARTLGAVRDLDVAMACDELAPHRDALRRRHAVAWAEVQRLLHEPGTRTLFCDLATGPLVVTGGDTPIIALAAAVLDRARHRLARRARRFAKLTPGGRHRVRMAAKRLHDLDQFFAGLFASAGRKRTIAGFSHRLDRLQDRLGVLNDRVVGRALVESLSGAAAAVDDDARAVHRAEHRLREVLELRPYWRGA
jgi:triphosphatase